MMKFPTPTAVVGCCVAMICFMNCGKGATSVQGQSLSDQSASDGSASLASDQLWIDTIMFADGHSFGYEGDISMWGGWYFDTIYVGNDMLLKTDSIAPATLKLNLYTRDLIVNMGDPTSADKIKRFLSPIDGFKRYTKKFDEALDTIITEDNEKIISTASFDFVLDYAADHPKSDMINGFVCKLACESGDTKVDVPPLTSLYIGYNPQNETNKAYKGKAYDMASLCDYISNNAIAEWRTNDDSDYISTALGLAVRANLSCQNFVTFSRFRYDRLGLGHGMYTETFHTLDLNTGKSVTNKELFKNNSIDDVKMLLFEVMAADPYYRSWHEGVESASDILAMIEGWQAPDPLLEGTEFEEVENDIMFTLPNGALTNEGVIFSFQPYEIDCWAAGAYHFIVPYDKLKPYLTEKAKTLAGLK